MLRISFASRHRRNVFTDTLKYSATSASVINLDNEYECDISGLVIISCAILDLHY